MKKLMSVLFMMTVLSASSAHALVDWYSDALLFQTEMLLNIYQAERAISNGNYSQAFSNALMAASNGSMSNGYATMASGSQGIPTTDLVNSNNEMINRADFLQQFSEQRGGGSGGGKPPVPQEAY